jgi:hypothetical protein
MDLEEVGCEDVNWIHVALDRDQWLALLDSIRSHFILFPFSRK